MDLTLRCSEIWSCSDLLRERRTVPRSEEQRGNDEQLNNWTIEQGKGWLTRTIGQNYQLNFHIRVHLSLKEELNIYVFKGHTHFSSPAVPNLLFPSDFHWKIDSRPCIGRSNLSNLGVGECDTSVGIIGRQHCCITRWARTSRNTRRRRISSCRIRSIEPLHAASIVHLYTVHKHYTTTKSLTNGGHAA